MAPPADAPYEPVPLSFERLAPEERLRRSRAFLETMERRRSCRFFTDEPVDEALVINAVRAAGSGPSGANEQPWTFVVVRDAATKARIRAAAEEEERTPSHAEPDGLPRRAARAPRPRARRALLPVGLPARDASVPRHALSRKRLDEILVWR